jgi:hypothetical protein
MTLLQRPTDPPSGIVLNSWLDADGQPQGNASTSGPSPDARAASESQLDPEEPPAHTRA